MQFHTDKMKIACGKWTWMNLIQSNSLMQSTAMTSGRTLIYLKIEGQGKKYSKPLAFIQKYLGVFEEDFWSYSWIFFSEFEKKAQECIPVFGPQGDGHRMSSREWEKEKSYSGI